MTKESVLTILERNPHYHDFKNEFKGGVFFIMFLEHKL